MAATQVHMEWGLASNLLHHGEPSNTSNATFAYDCIVQPCFCLVGENPALRYVTRREE